MNLAILLAALVPAFALTYIIVDRYKNQRRQLAVEWSERGQRDMAASRPAAAVVDFQTALAYGRDRQPDEFRLAEALIAASRPAEARARLLTLWAEEPGRAEIALDLAHLAAADGNVGDAVRYYHAAIDGAWASDAASARRGARLELARLLLANGQNIGAQAELIAIISDLPPDAELVTQVGSLLVDSGADSRAMTLFQRALALDPGQATAARLAGQVAFRAANYQDARRFLADAAEHSTLDAQSRDMLDLAGRVLSRDPAVRGIGARAHAQRVHENLAIARARLARCQASSSTANEGEPLATLGPRVEAAGKLQPGTIQRDADLSDQLMALVFEVEALPSSLCGAATPDDRALQLIAEQRRVK